MGRAAVALLGIVTLAAAGAATAQSDATPDGRLLARYVPTLVLHPQERFAPVPVEGFLADSDLLEQDAAGGWAAAATPLAEASAQSRLDQRSCRAIEGPSAVPCYADAEASHAAPPTAYGAVFRTAARIVLQYWLFYPYDAWSPTDPTGPFWKAHEGDWESVTVILDRQERPLVVGASRHCGGVQRPWAATSKRNGRPLVWVGLGAHAQAFKPGVFVEERRCWPEVALAIYDAYGVTMLDRAATGRTVTPRVVRVRATAPAWMRFPGTWGEDQYAAFPVVPPFRFGAGPAGPAFHEQWRKPLAVPLGWPRG